MHWNYYSFAIRKANHNANETFWLVKVTRAGAHTVAELLSLIPASLMSTVLQILVGGARLHFLTEPLAAPSTVVMHHFEHSSVLIHFSGPVHMKNLSTDASCLASLYPRRLGSSPIQ